jgi:hypothetical protein
MNPSVLEHPSPLFSHENVIDVQKFRIDSKVFLVSVLKHPPGTRFHSNCAIIRRRIQGKGLQIKMGGEYEMLWKISAGCFFGWKVVVRTPVRLV